MFEDDDGDDDDGTLSVTGITLKYIVAFHVHVFLVALLQPLARFQGYRLVLLELFLWF